MIWCLSLVRYNSSSQLHIKVNTKIKVNPMQHMLTVDTTNEMKQISFNAFSIRGTNLEAINHLNILSSIASNLLRPAHLAVLPFLLNCVQMLPNDVTEFSSPVVVEFRIIVIAVPRIDDRLH